MAIDWSFLGGTGADGGFQMNPQFLQMLAQAGAGLGKGQSVGEALGGATSQALRMNTLMGKNPQQLVTAPNQPGPNSITQTTTDKGTTYKVDMPNPNNLPQSNVPAESIKTPSMGGSEAGQSPFWKMLLGQM